MHLTEREEGRQRRKTKGGRLLHCCCICGALEPWGSTWSCFCSVRDMDEERPFPKFCSAKCKKAGGAEAANVTEEMCAIAKAREWRKPKPYYRAPTYMDALDEQRRALAAQQKEKG